MQTVFSFICNWISINHWRLSNDVSRAFSLNKEAYLYLGKKGKAYIAYCGKKWRQTTTGPNVRCEQGRFTTTHLVKLQIYWLLEISIVTLPYRDFLIPLSVVVNNKEGYLIGLDNFPLKILYMCSFSTIDFMVSVTCAGQTFGPCELSIGVCHTSGFYISRNYPQFGDVRYSSVN